ncbi:2086_t:CDS:2 [Funneliformis caledonium]|uniref:2086_t:CDS:1 n=1 Tax=Funneliformis caledonium TaxID=1117310 RepID=A0A9N8WP37_9GLOM|nr:2086_t:CDS:2 [Funneliformis caledonium]
MAISTLKHPPNNILKELDGHSRNVDDHFGFVFVCRNITCFWNDSSLDEKLIKTLDVTVSSGSKLFWIYAKAYDFVTSLSEMCEKLLENNVAGFC